MHPFLYRLHDREAVFSRRTYTFPLPKQISSSRKTILNSRYRLRVATTGISWKCSVSDLIYCTSVCHSYPGIGYLLIAPSDEPDHRWTVTYRNKMPLKFGSSAFYARIQTIGYADDLERSIQTGDKFAERKMGRALYTKSATPRHLPLG